MERTGAKTSFPNHSIGIFSPIDRRGRAGATIAQPFSYFSQVSSDLFQIVVFQYLIEFFASFLIINSWQLSGEFESPVVHYTCSVEREINC